MSNDIHITVTEKMQNALLLMLIWPHIKGLEEYQNNANIVKQTFPTTVFIFLVLTDIPAARVCLGDCGDIYSASMK